MLYREITVVCSQIHTKHTNSLCGQNVELLTVILAVRIVTTRSSELSAEAVQPDPTPPHTRTLTSFLNVAFPFSPVTTRRYINVSLYVVTPCCLVDREQCFGDISFLLPTSKALHPANCNLDTLGLTVLELHLHHEDQPFNLVLGNNRRLLHLKKLTNTLCGNAVLLRKWYTELPPYTGGLHLSLWHCISETTHARTHWALAHWWHFPFAMSVNTQNTPLLSNTRVNIL